jgi:selenocysteine lyase/cysteine desulfurase
MSDFNAAYPGYETTARLDELRATEYSYLDEDGHVYLDYTGAGLPARSQLRAHAARLRSGVYGNPHSDNPTSSAATLLVERARATVLRYFNTTADDYAVIFTPNATGACRLVGEAYPFGRRTRLVLTADNHNSVNGIREYAARAGARVAYVGLHGRELRVSTIMGVSVDGGWHQMLAGEAGFEDGTVNFLSIPDVTVGLDWISGVGIDLIHQRVGILTSWLLDCLGRMRLGSVAPMVRVYGPPTGIARGGTVALNFLDPDGQVITSARGASRPWTTTCRSSACRPAARSGSRSTSPRRSTMWTRFSTSPSAGTATAAPTWPACRRGTAASRAARSRRWTAADGR